MLPHADELTITKLANCLSSQPFQVTSPCQSSFLSLQNRSYFQSNNIGGGDCTSYISLIRSVQLNPSTQKDVSKNQQANFTTQMKDFNSTSHPLVLCIFPLVYLIEREFYESQPPKASRYKIIFVIIMKNPARRRVGKGVHLVRPRHLPQT